MDSKDYVQQAYRSILQNDFKAAIQFFEAAIAENPNDAEVHYRCSITYTRSNRLDKGIEHAEFALRLAPDKSEYQLYLQHLRAMLLVQEARKQIDLGQAKSTVNLYQALPLLKEAITLDPLYRESYIWLALAYSELNEYALAISTLKEVILFHPEDQGLKDWLEQLKNRLKSYLQDS